MPVFFHVESIQFKLKQTRAIKQWVKAVIEKHEMKLGVVSYVFCSDEFLLKMNQEHLNHDYYTDIITFDYSEKGVIEGDIFISIDRVRENAISERVVFENELHRVMIHGILHLLGFKDKTKKEQELMRLNENQALMLFESLNVPRGTL